MNRFRMRFWLVMSCINISICSFALDIKFTADDPELINILGFISNEFNKANQQISEGDAFNDAILSKQVCRIGTMWSYTDQKGKISLLNDLRNVFVKANSSDFLISCRLNDYGCAEINLCDIEWDNIFKEAMKSWGEHSEEFLLFATCGAENYGVSEAIALLDDHNTDKKFWHLFLRNNLYDQIKRVGRALPDADEKSKATLLNDLRTVFITVPLKSDRAL